VLPLTRGSTHFAHPGIMKRRSQITDRYKERHRREMGKKKCQKWRQNKLINQEHHNCMIVLFCKQEIYGLRKKNTQKGRSITTREHFKANKE
jgi:hypothetical protein